MVEVLLQLKVFIRWMGGFAHGRLRSNVTCVWILRLYIESHYIAFDTLSSKLFRKLNESENTLPLYLHCGFVRVLRISKSIKEFIFASFL